MIDAADLTRAFARNVNIIKSQTAGLTNEESLHQHIAAGNCLNWVMGHILLNRDGILATLGAPPSFGVAGARYKRESEPLHDAEDGALPLADLLALLDQAQARIAAALAGLDEAALAREIPAGDRMTTVGRQAFFQYFHETYHVGQTELFRQLAGRADKII